MARVEKMEVAVAYWDAAGEGMDGAERVAGTAEAVAPRILSTNVDACQCTWGR